MGSALSGTGCIVMTWLHSGARNGLRCGVLGLAAAVAVLSITSDAADARHHRRLRVHYVRYVHTHHASRASRHSEGEGYSPPTASIVVDGNTGRVLEASNADAPRHPASLTKVMTLYLLFERLDTGKLKLDTPLTVSEHAADQDPTKLGLRPGQTITVEDAIKGIVTRSANDAAVVVAENLGGSEREFAKLMTQKAHALGMSRTIYVNASGLPDDDQITTARDLALLGRAIQERFPRYYKYFSTRSFVYHGHAIGNHDHLLGAVEGVDGIKTGFTRASGFNLLTSLHRDGRYLVAVVLGGRSSFERDAHMRELLGEHIKEAAATRTAPLVEEAQREEAQPVAFAKGPMINREPAVTATVNARAAAVGSSAPIQPVPVKTISYRIAPVETAPLSPMPMLMPIPAPPRPASAAHTQRAVAPAEPPRTAVASAEASPAALRAPASVQFARIEPQTSEPGKATPVKDMHGRTDIPDAEPVALVHARGGWLIQIGAYDGQDEARQHLTEAQMKVRGKLAKADPFTERVQKGDKALYRARFAGFDKATAEAACKELKRNDFDCMALKD